MSESVKCTFGLTPKNIEIIEKKLAEFGSSRYSWQDIGKAIGWAPDEAAYWYIRHLLKTKETNDTKTD